MLASVHGLLRPAGDYGEPAILVVAVDHFLDVLVLVVAAAVADILPVAVPVADSGNRPGDWD